MGTEYISDVTADLDIPVDGTLSRVLHRGDRLRVVGFAFDEGQELTEHTAAVQVISGRVQVTVGDETHDAVPAAWLWMDANVAHSLVATEPSHVLLTLLPGAGGAD